MEQNREPRNKPKSLWSINIRQWGQKHKMDKIASSINGVDRSGQLHAKNKNVTQSSIYTIHKNKFKVNKRVKYKL